MTTEQGMVEFEDLPPAQEGEARQKCTFCENNATKVARLEQKGTPYAARISCCSQSECERRALQSAKDFFVAKT